MRCEGRVLPFGTWARCVHPAFGQFEQAIWRGAFAPALRHPSPVPVLINHSFDHVVARECVLREQADGLYVHGVQMDDALFLELARGRSELRLSISMPFELESEWAEPPLRRQLVTRVPFIREISICHQKAPNFAGTWLMPKTERSRWRRIQAELDVLERELQRARRLA